MSRREFRGEVAAPRPPAAWLMSIVSSATLWLTEQLPLWIVALQLVAFSVSFATRTRPPAFRRDPIWLNILMFGVSGVTIRSALSGNPATISLAYFTALAQGLQLLDARPRKSEFVLVALALFQVVLASNLTDSVFFPPLVIVFLACVTWTLLVHTLALEAAEAGQPDAIDRIVAPDLRRLTAIATSVCLVLAMGLFLILPRLKTSVVQGTGGGGIGLSGFSNEVRLGDVGRIRMDRSTVLRVEAVEGALPEPIDAYWRGLAFDAFDGRSWSITPSERVGSRQLISGIGRFGIDLAPPSRAAASVQRILREPIDAEVLFSAGDAHRIEGPFQRLERDPNGGLYVPGQAGDRLRYTVWTDAAPRDATRLRGERARPPEEPGPGGPRPTTRYSMLPALDARLRPLAARFVEGAGSDFDRALRLESALREQGRYTDSPPPLGDETTSPIEAFLLGELQGHCEYFASAMVVLARLEGLPARLVNGFAGGQPNLLGGFIEVTQADAHAWVEIHFEESGWIRFDPTPPDLRLRAEPEPSLAERLRELASAIELFWFQHVVDYDSADQIGALRSLFQRLSPREGIERPERPDVDSPLEALQALGRTLREGAAVLPILLFAAAASLAVLQILRARRRTVEGLPESYRRAQRLLARQGLHRAPETSAHDFVREVARVVPEPGARAFAHITDAYLAERFGGRPASDQRDQLTALQDAVDRMGLRDQAHIR